ncbi:MAG: YraN family protein [Syntrophales bacterium]|nr:YraN family protein [Syntrophales bacterium]
MTRERLKTGQLGEDAAVSYLEARGYKILERNFRCPLGEMDIIARQANVLVFIEVRSRRSEGFGDPLESVTVVKQRKLSRIALFYIQKHNLQNREARFDVLGITMRPGGQEIDLIQNAFEVRS